LKVSFDSKYLIPAGLNDASKQHTKSSVEPRVFFALEGPVGITVNHGSLAGKQEEQINTLKASLFREDEFQGKHVHNRDF
jgi:hypothetical protein